MTDGLCGLTAKILGNRIIALLTVDSTNNYLKDNGEQLPNGTLCYTGWQQAGRGRLGRSWCAEEGQALAMSLLFKPSDGLEQLSLVCGLAVSRALSRLCGQMFQIKWPNDIVCGGRKVCGILCENRWTGNNGFVVAGIGVNLRQTAAAFEKAGLPYAVSLEMVSGQAFTVEKTAAAIVNELEPLWLRLKQEGFSSLRGEYEQGCITVGRPVRVLSLGGSILLEGIAVGIAEEGYLLVDSGSKIVPVSAGEVSVRGLDGYL